MGQYSVEDAASHLSDLIERALQGETVMITRDGNPVVEMRPVPAVGKRVSPPGPITIESLDWLDARRIGTTVSAVDAATLVRQMRDESDH